MAQKTKDEDDMEELDHEVANYPSAEAHEKFLLAQYRDEETIHMTSIWESLDEAAADAGCEPHQMVFGALGWWKNQPRKTRRRSVSYKMVRSQGQMCKSLRTLLNKGSAPGQQISRTSSPWSWLRTQVLGYNS